VTYRQAQALSGQIRKGEHGLLIVYADHMRRTETAGNGDVIECEIPFLKGYTVFNGEQMTTRPSNSEGPPLPCPLPPASKRPNVSPPRSAPLSATAAAGLSTPSKPTACNCLSLKALLMPRAINHLAARANALDAVHLAPYPRIRTQALMQ
jgi:hypothetical protein